jgi:hypothetical protein
MSLDWGNIAPTDLRDFAKSRGWVQVNEAIVDGLFVLTNPEFERRQLVFPINSAAPDYQDAVNITVSKLAETENKSIQLLVSDLNELYDDTIRFRVVDFRNEENFIPLSYAVSAINGAREMFLSAACTVLKPQVHHPRLSRAEAQQLVDKSRFRQTEKGSFIIKISAPVKAMEIRGNLYDENLPFVRQTTLAINHGLNKLITAIQADTLGDLIAEMKTSERPELSSNICRSVVEFQEEHNDFDLYMDFAWAGILPNTREIQAPNTIKIQKEYFTRIDDVRRELRATEDHDLEDVFIATVEHLAGDIGPDGHRAGEVILDLYKESEIIRARTNLGMQDYEKADHSHMTPNSYIKVKGRLQPGNQPRILTDITSFELIMP